MLKDLTNWVQKLKAGHDLAHNFYFENKARLPKNIKKIFFVGMGGSGISGRIIKTFLDKKSNIPVFIVDGSELPSYIDTESLAITISYSGNTWETIDILNSLVEKFIPTIVLSHGGKAAEIAKNKNLPFILLPESSQPRAALGNFLGIILSLFDLMGILDCKNILETFIKTSEIYIPKLLQQVYFAEFLSLAKDYDFFHIWGVSGDSGAFAYRAQTQFNENSKVQAVNSNIPECCHNLLVGFTNFAKKPLVLLFYSDFLPSHEIVAVEATTEILLEQGVLLYKIPVFGDNWEGQLFSMILWSDFASYYLGQIKGVEIAPVKLINRLKEKHLNKGIK